MNVDGYALKRSPALFVRDFERNADRCTFMFALDADERRRWAKMPGAHPKTTPCMPALIAAGLR